MAVRLLSLHENKKELNWIELNWIITFLQEPLFREDQVCGYQQSFKEKYVYLGSKATHYYLGDTRFEHSPGIRQRGMKFILNPLRHVLG
jgi:hypothetical protein